MAFQIVETDSTPGFAVGPDEDEYRVAEPRWRVRGRPEPDALPSAGWIPVLRALRAQLEVAG